MLVKYELIMIMFIFHCIYEERSNLNYILIIIQKIKETRKYKLYYFST